MKCLVILFFQTHQPLWLLPSWNQLICIGVWMNFISETCFWWWEWRGRMWLRNALGRRNMKEVGWDGGQGMCAAAKSPSLFHVFIYSFMKKGENLVCFVAENFVHSLILIAGCPRGAWVDHELLNKWVPTATCLGIWYLKLFLWEAALLQICSAT